MLGVVGLLKPFATIIADLLYELLKILLELTFFVVVLHVGSQFCADAAVVLDATD